MQILVLFIFYTFCFCESYKILAVFPFPAHSHYTLGFKVMTELANRGHEVTFVTPYPQKIPPQNVKQISVEGIVPIIIKQRKDLYFLDQQSIIENIHFMTNFGYFVTKEILENENITKLLQSEEQYDLVVLQHFLNEALLGIAHHFKVPFVLLSSMPLWSWNTFLFAHPASSSYSPNIMTQYTGHMNFWQRLLNSVYDAYSILYHQLIILPKHRQLVKKHIPGGPELNDFISNVSLLLINTHPSFFEPKPELPNIIEIGGVHLQEPQKLSKDLQKFLDDSVHGVVIFSMGSLLKSSELSASKRNVLLKTFAKLNQSVLWKWEDDDLPGLPKNVKIMKWLPQSDVLAHSNVKVFITHGGLFSTIESIYHGVPVIGIPVFADQKMNIASAVSRGYALVVPFQELTEEKLTHALHQILTDPKYKENIVHRSKILRDRPTKPMDDAIYWIEYVVRHQGAKHLRYPGMDLTWYQRHLLDVIGFLVTTGLVVFLAIYTVLKKIKKQNKTYNNKTKKNN